MASDLNPDDILELVTQGYDELAERFVSPFYETYENKPVDREMLERFLSISRSDGRICDVGCGIGPAARFLHEAGRTVVGVDISEKAIERARDLHPGIPFEVGNLLSLGFESGALAGAVSLFSIIHLPRTQLPDAVAELWRVLEPGGALLVSCYKGSGSRMLEPEEGHAVRMFSTHLMADDLTGLLEGAGFEVLNVEEREPYKYEFEGDRIFALARRPDPDHPSEEEADAAVLEPTPPSD